MRQILLDTSALYALADGEDPDHQAVADFVRGIEDATLIVTDYILDETLTLIKFWFGSQPAIEMGKKLRTSHFCTLVQSILKPWPLIITSTGWGCNGYHNDR